MTEPSQYFKGRTVQEQMNEVIGYVDTRAAEVATAAIASDVAQVHQDMLDADADAQAAAASAAAAAGTLANAVKKTGEASQSIAGDIAVAGTLSGGVVTGTQVTVPTPVNNTDAATKKYVDDADALDVHLAGNEAITGNKTVPLEATGTFSNQIASSNKVKNELDNYQFMVRTVDDQVVNGPKRIKNPILGVIGNNKRVTGTGAIEIGRFPYNDNVTIEFTCIISGRAKLMIGMVEITTGTNEITNISVPKSIYLNNETFTQASLYAYIDDTNVVLCIGNSTSGNYIYSVVPLGLFRGAALPYDLDVSYAGTNITLPASYVSVVI